MTDLHGITAVAAGGTPVPFCAGNFHGGSFGNEHIQFNSQIADISRPHLPNCKDSENPPKSTPKIGHYELVPRLPVAPRHLAVHLLVSQQLTSGLSTAKLLHLRALHLLRVRSLRFKSITTNGEFHVDRFHQS